MPETRKIGNFELLERVGQGGMGAVFKARQLSLDRIVALKVLPPSLAKKPQFIERFMREARASARLNHPNIVNGIDVGQDSGIYYFAMEFVEGQSVKEKLKAGKMSEAESLGIARAMALALAHAHAHGILHRDIKPDNILLKTDGTPKLCDLGLACLDEESAEQKGLTQDGHAVGTPHYISPEQARGEHDLDAKTDLYSLGATLYHMLTGTTPYDGPTSVVIMTKHITEKMRPPADLGTPVSRSTMQVLGKLLAKDRGDRYESAQTLSDDLQRVMNGQPPRNAVLPPSKWPFTTPLHTTGPKKPVGEPGGAAKSVGSDLSQRHVRKTAGGFPWPVLALIPIFAAVAYFVFSTKPKADSANTSSMNSNENKMPAQPIDTGKTPAAKTEPAKTLPQQNVSPLEQPHTPNRTVEPAPKTEAGKTPAPQTDTVSTPAPQAPILTSDKTTPSIASPVEEKKTESETKKSEEEKPTAPIDPETDTKKAVPVQTETPPEPARARKTAPGDEVLVLIGKALTLYKDGKYHEAAEIYKLPQEKIDAFDEFDKGAVKLRQNAFAGWGDLKPLLIERLKASPNGIEANAVFTRKLGGKLVGGDEKALFMQDQNVEVPYPWARLSLEELRNLTEHLLIKIPSRIALALGIVGYDQGDDSFSRQVLKGNQDDPIARQILDLIDQRDQALIAKRHAQMNSEAEKLFGELEKALTDSDFKGVAGKGALLRSRYADSDIMKEKSADVEDMLQTARMVQEGGMRVQPGNLALASNGATATHPALIDGITTGYGPSSGFAIGSWPCDFEVTLPKPALLREIRILLWDGDDRFYRYQLQVSSDGKKYTMAADRGKGEWRSWQTIKLIPQIVKSIRVKGLHNSANSSFHIVEIEAYSIPPLSPAKPKERNTEKK